LAILVSQAPLLVTLATLATRLITVRLALKKERRDERREVIDDLKESRAALKDLVSTREQKHQTTNNVDMGKSPAIEVDG
jgi:hypothetical protein